MSVGLSLAIAFAAYLTLRSLLPAGTDPIQPKDLTQFSLVIAAGIGGVVALVVAYRRQQGIELGRFIERFGAAAGQLGHPDVAVRLAGVYAMAGVADDTLGHERQQCIDVLCGYLRLAYFSATGENHESELVHKVPARGGEVLEHRYQYRLNDKEVRQTVLRIITAHLQLEARESWSACDFDFTGVYFEDADFFHAIFRGGTTSFARASLAGKESSFENTTFDSGFTDFSDATFTAQRTSFMLANFRNIVAFDRATFGGKETLFNLTTFSGTSFSFRAVNFGKGTVSFVPLHWTPAPKFDWDEELSEAERRPKPDNVAFRDRGDGARSVRSDN
ncbi:hypothetical protein [Arthrobacter sp. SO3]|uniref:hypothetical protein n=1 Tax=Arthrobacter sp. SO3 TaxID=1897057 RepID=UPI001CFFF51C|nr:hypothetical protein [Arthrobacter sp. SO3]